MSRLTASNRHALLRALAQALGATHVVDGIGYDRLDANDPHTRAVLNDIADKLNSHFGRSIPTEPNALADYARKRIAERHVTYGARRARKRARKKPT